MMTEDPATPTIRRIATRLGASSAEASLTFRGMWDVDFTRKGRPYRVSFGAHPGARIYVPALTGLDHETVGNRLRAAAAILDHLEAGPRDGGLYPLVDPDSGGPT